MLTCGVKLNPTRYAEPGIAIYIGKIAPGLWQCCVDQDGNCAQTGPQCKTKMEAYSILASVAEQWGFK